MLNPEETKELRALHAKAYGRDGGLTDAEASRLRELEESRAALAATAASISQDTVVEDLESATASAVTVADISAASPRDPEAPPRDDEVSSQAKPLLRADRARETPAPHEDVADAHTDESSVPAAPTGPRAALALLRRSRWSTIATASLVLLLIGLGAGWALFGRNAGEVALTPAQQERRIELDAKGEYDPGSLRIIGLDDEATVWFGTKQDETLECVVLDIGEKSATACQRADEIVNGNGNAYANLTVGTGEQVTQVSAVAVRAANGEVVAVLQRWEQNANDWLAQFAGDDVDRARELMDEGFEIYSVSIVGYFRDEPVWTAERFDEATTQLCLIIDAVESTTCASSEEARSEGLSVGFVTVDSSGAKSENWNMQLGYTTWGSAYLTISGDEDAVWGSRDGATSSDSGTPIRIEVPSDESEG